VHLLRNLMPLTASLLMLGSHALANGAAEERSRSGQEHGGTCPRGATCPTNPALVGAPHAFISPYEYVDVNVALDADVCHIKNGCPQQQYRSDTMTIELRGRPDSHASNAISGESEVAWGVYGTGGYIGQLKVERTELGGKVSYRVEGALIPIQDRSSTVRIAFEVESLESFTPVILRSKTVKKGKFAITPVLAISPAGR
jgi:hypothetical protein